MGQAQQRVKRVKRKAAEATQKSYFLKRARLQAEEDGNQSDPTYQQISMQLLRPRKSKESIVDKYKKEDEERELHRKRNRKPDEQLKPDASSKPKPDLPMSLAPPSRRSIGQPSYRASVDDQEAGAAGGDVISAPKIPMYRSRRNSHPEREEQPFQAFLKPSAPSLPAPIDTNQSHQLNRPPAAAASSMRPFDNAPGLLPPSTIFRQAEGATVGGGGLRALSDNTSESGFLLRPLPRERVEESDVWVRGAVEWPSERRVAGDWRDGEMPLMSSRLKAGSDPPWPSMAPASHPPLSSLSSMRIGPSHDDRYMLTDSSFQQHHNRNDIGSTFSLRPLAHAPPSVQGQFELMPPAAPVDHPRRDNAPFFLQRHPPAPQHTHTTLTASDGWMQPSSSLSAMGGPLEGYAAAVVRDPQASRQGGDGGWRRPASIGGPFAGEQVGDGWDPMSQLQERRASGLMGGRPHATMQQPFQPFPADTRVIHDQPSLTDCRDDEPDFAHPSSVFARPDRPFAKPPTPPLSRHKDTNMLQLAKAAALKNALSLPGADGGVPFTLQQPPPISVGANDHEPQQEQTTMNVNGATAMCMKESDQWPTGACGNGDGEGVGCGEASHAQVDNGVCAEECADEESCVEEACGDPSAGARRLNFPAVLELSPDSSSPLPPFCKQERSQQADSVRQPDSRPALTTINGFPALSLFSLSAADREKPLLQILQTIPVSREAREEQDLKTPAEKQREPPAFATLMQAQTPRPFLALMDNQGHQAAAAAAAAASNCEPQGHSSTPHPQQEAICDTDSSAARSLSSRAADDDMDKQQKEHMQHQCYEFSLPLPLTRVEWKVPSLMLAQSVPLMFARDAHIHNTHSTDMFQHQQQQSLCTVLPCHLMYRLIANT
ncbi:unnamed protein product [Vitrella brassicaformis CCMP3155]|uniref:Uncharacterized protein n=1 Tax=Vitrella brassicaformis (strain CCMP3155) TaxID=1169540 RepID=A0A0G4FGV1_VITBC|nr:unnamed protein product [Vitrella brassicaformis CCMP3155]|eukprot:CEM12075.1 unnamed protein product [Vitrella brassicaformis CCMP3155]